MNTKKHPFQFEDWIALVLVLFLIPVILFHQRLGRDHTGFLQSQAGMIESHALISTDLTGRWLDRRYRVRSTLGYHFTLQIRRPSNLSQGNQIPVLIILGGIETGSGSVRLIESESNFMVVGIDYAYDGKTRYGNLEFLTALPRISEALAESFGAVMLTIEFVHMLPEVDTNRVIIVGSSFGTPYGVIATAFDQRIDGLIIPHGGGHVVDMVLHQLPDNLKPFTSLLWPIAAYILAPYEPLRYIHQIAPRPFLMINAAQDERIPYHAANDLYNSANEPKKIIWLESKHILPSRKKLINEMLSISESWLKEMGLLN